MEFAPTIINEKNPIIIRIPFPYDRTSHQKAREVWAKVQEKYKSKEDTPPCELVYASQKKLIHMIQRNSRCTLCRLALGGNGIYFPVENDLIIPYPCCEACCESKTGEKFVYVGKFIRRLRYYTWKMVIGANLADYYYQQVLKEEEETIHKIMEKKEEENTVDDNLCSTSQDSLSPERIEMVEEKSMVEENKSPHYSFEFSPIEKYYTIDTSGLALPCEEKKNKHDFFRDVRFWLLSFFIFSGFSLSFFFVRV